MPRKKRVTHAPPFFVRWPMGVINYVRAMFDPHITTKKAIKNAFLAFVATVVGALLLDPTLLELSHTNTSILLMFVLGKAFLNWWKHRGDEKST